MMEKVLVDTDIFSEILKGKNSNVMRRASESLYGLELTDRTLPADA
jgi:hypothetical protein